MNPTTCASEPRYCPIEECLDLLAGAWTPHILWNLSQRPRRFGELKRLLDGVSAKVLTTRLREHEARGLISRHVLPTSPPSVEYRLTEFGREFEPLLCSIAELGHRLRRRAARDDGAADGADGAAPAGARREAPR